MKSYINLIYLVGCILLMFVHATNQLINDIANAILLLAAFTSGMNYTHYQRNHK